MESSTLYHYTDFNAMRGIINNGEIWLWNLRRMNDSQEMQYFIKELKIAVKKRINPSYYGIMKEIFDNNLRNFGSISSYASCFSEYADDAAQWARYGKGGMGVCIAFQKDKLELIGKEAHVPLFKVNYWPDCDHLPLVEELCRIIEDPDYPEEKIHEIFNNLVSSSPLFKHPSFISEKEYRLVGLPHALKELGESHFFVEETNIKKYYILNLKRVAESLGIHYADLFQEIRIGPEARVSEDVLKDYFNCTGMSELSDKVRTSECPLRRF